MPTEATPPVPRTFDGIRSAVGAERAVLLRHPLYSSLESLADVRVFMEQHAFAVLDFMSLLKALQLALTCADVPWAPRGDPVARRCVNELVLAEESDDVPYAGIASHFELYRAAMRSCGADTTRIDAFVGQLEAGEDVVAALAVAGAFTVGREDVIPSMFVQIVRNVSSRAGGRLTPFILYLERHVEVDGDRHAPLAARLLGAVCGTDASAWGEALQGARIALAARIALWNGVADAIQSSRVGRTEPQERGAEAGS